MARVDRGAAGPVALFCDRLRRLQQASGVKQAPLAAAAGRSTTQMSFILNGRIRRAPDWEVVEAIVRTCLAHTGRARRVVPPDLGDLEDWRRRHLDLEQDLDARTRLAADGLAAEEPDAPDRVPDSVFRTDVRALLEATADRAAQSDLPQHLLLDGDADVRRMARTVRLLGQVRSSAKDREVRDPYGLPGDRENRNSAPPQSWKQIAAEHDRVVVLGDSGMGKSWLLRLEACRLAEAALAPPGGPVGEGVAVPVLMRADILAAAPGANVAEKVAGYLVSEGLLEERSQERMKALVDAGGVVLLVDALDEIPRNALAEERQTPRKRLEDLLNGWVEEQYLGRGRRRFVVASRLEGYTRLSARGVKEVELLPFTQNDIDAAIKAWKLPGGTDEWLRRQFGNPAVAAMARVPLLLALICSLAVDRRQRDEDLPVTRAELYRQVVWQFLSGAHRASEKGGLEYTRESADLENLEDVLGSVAIAFADDSRGWIDRMPGPDLKKAILKAGDSFAGLGVSVLAAITRLIETGILVPAGNPANIDQDYVFLHRTFAEYLVARHLRYLDSGPRMEMIARHQWFDPGWAEVIPMLGGLLSSHSDEEASALVCYFLAQDPDPLHYAFLTALRLLGETAHPDRLVPRGRGEDLARRTGQMFGGGFETRKMLSRALASASAWPRPVMMVVMEALAHQGELVRVAAVDALAGRNGDDVTRILIDQCANDQDSFVCEAAIKALARRDGDDVTRMLLKQLVRTWDRPGFLAWAVPRVAVEALARREGDSVTRALTDLLAHPELDVSAQRALARRDGDTVTGALMGLLADERKHSLPPSARALAVEVLAGRVGDEVTRKLLELLKDDHAYVRHAAVTALGGREGDEVTRKLLDLLAGERDRSIRKDVVAALGRREGDEVSRKLLELLKGGDFLISDQASGALAGRGGDDVTNRLLALLNDDKADARAGAAWALNGRDGEEVTRRLLDLLTDDREHTVRWRAILALAGRDGNDVTRALLRVLNDTDWELRGLAARVLAEREGDDVTQALLHALNDDEAEVREEAVKALAGRDGNDVTQALLGLFVSDITDDQKQVCGAAVNVLAEREGDDVTRELLHLIHHQEYVISSRAIDAARRRDDPKILSMLAFPDSSLKRSLSPGMRLLLAESVTDRLYLRVPSEERARVLRGLAEITPG
jgi:HEAT repeat protein